MTNGADVWGESEQSFKLIGRALCRNQLLSPRANNLLADFSKGFVRERNNTTDLTFRSTRALKTMSSEGPTSEREKRSVVK